tara:strand:- start:82 stop:312 length:231 start_codon:yes stop_codon:yes gene_type:complete
MKILLDDWIENWRDSFVKENKLYHGTSDIYLQDILENGFNNSSQWGTIEDAVNNAGVIAGEVGGNPMIIEAAVGEV